MATTNQNLATSTTLNIGKSDGYIKVRVSGAFGNTIEVKVVNDSENDDNTTASYEYPTLTVELADDGSSITASVSEVESVINDVDEFEIISSNYSNDESVDSTIESSLSGGEDVVTVGFSENIETDTVDTGDVNTDFGFKDAMNVTSTSISISQSRYIEIEITESDAQILGDKINVKSGAIEDLNGNEADTSPVTIERPQAG